MSKNPHYRAGLMALSFALLPLAMLVSRPAGADELMKWERIPLQILDWPLYFHTLFIT